MAKRITELTSATSLAETDVLPIVDVSDTTQATSGTTKKSALSLIADYIKTRVETLTNKTLISPLFGGTIDGWIDAQETWTYASATTITVPSGAASKYQKGDKIKLTQTTVKYFYVVGVADTVLTVTGGSDYTVANAAITSPYYSKIENPQGFPQYFSFTPSWTNLTPGSGTNRGRFTLIGRTVHFVVEFVFGTGSAVGTAAVKLARPIPNTDSSWSALVANALYLDAGVSAYVGNMVDNGDLTLINCSGTYSAMNYVSTNIPFTWGADDLIAISGTYEMV